MATRGDAYRNERGQPGGAAVTRHASAGSMAGAAAHAARIADRYYLEDRISECGQYALWRAFDGVLGRAVTVRTFRPDSAGAGEVIAAARAASRVPDDRLARVFDAHVGADYAYIVTEWPDGESLEDLLMAGHLDVTWATRIVAEVAGAIAAAHAGGIAHLRLTPRAVLWSRDSGVKIVGLGIDAALAGAAPANAGTTATAAPVADTRSLAMLLYAMLTGYWPGDQETALPAAPRRDGRPYRPRQVRAGVPARIDDITCRALFEPLPRDPPAVTSPAQFAELLSGALRYESWQAAHAAVASGAAFMDATGSMGGISGIDVIGGEAGSAARPPWPPPRRRVRRLAAGGVVGALFVLDSALIGVSIMGAAHPPPIARAVAHSHAPASLRAHQQVGRLLAPVSAQPFDPYGGNEDENNGLAPAAIDGDPTTAWHTFWYTTPRFGNLKPGTGLLVDMGRSATIRSVRVVFGSMPGANVQLRIGDGADSLAEMGVAATADDVSGTVTLRSPAAYRGRYVLIWFTRLPPEDAGQSRFQADIFDVAVYGS